MINVMAARRIFWNRPDNPEIMSILLARDQINPEVQH